MQAVFVRQVSIASRRYSTTNRAGSSACIQDGSLLSQNCSRTCVAGPSKLFGKLLAELFLPGNQSAEQELFPLLKCQPNYSARKSKRRHASPTVFHWVCWFFRRFVSSGVSRSWNSRPVLMVPGKTKERLKHPRNGSSFLNFLQTE